MSGPEMASPQRMPPAFRRLCAREQLAVLREYPRLIPRLMGWGLGLADAQALAYNATILCCTAAVSPPLRHPADVLERYSLAEIAELCECLHRVQQGELEYGWNGGQA